MAYSDNSFDSVWEELRKGNPEVINRADQRVAEILSREKQRGCPPDCNPGFCDDDPDEEICDRCWADWEKRKPKHTNADRLRAMSDEDLAEFMNHGACPPGKDSLSCIDEEYAHGRGPYVPPEKCRQCWLGWLRQEAKG